MPGEIFDFVWSVNNEGYRIADPGEVASYFDREAGPVSNEGVHSGEMIVASVGADGGTFKIRQYNPLRQHKCLFRVFAETNIEAEGIIDFANQYGLLGYVLDNIPVSNERPPLLRNIEPLAVWQKEILAMRRALYIWDMVQERDSDGLEAFLGPLMEWVEADKAYAGGDEPVKENPSETDPGELRWYRTHPECLDMYRSGDLFTSALLGVQFIANSHLERRVSPKILWDDSNRSGWSLYFVPFNLIGAIWLQLSQSITQEKDYRRCRQCGSWFEIDHYTARTNRYFCSNACRSKAYRDRQSMAHRMHKEGASIADIATRLGSDAETVRGWIKKAV